MKTFKKIFCLFYLFLFTLSSIPKESLAQQTYPYVFDAKAQGTQITVTLSGVPAADRGKANIFIEPLNTFPIGLVCPIGSSDIKCAASVQPTKTISQNGTITWTRSASVSGGSIYYIRAEIDFGGTRAPYISAVKWVVTGAETVDAKWPLTYGKECNPSTIIGKLNNTNKADFTITIQYAGTAMPADESTPAGASGPIQSVNGINEDGTYSFILQNLEKNTQYFVKQIIRSKNGALDIKTDKFKTCQGYTPAGTNDEASDFNKRSYRLLAPISEKLQIVLDQDLCQEYVNEGKLQPGSCDNQISDFLNIILQILIGLAVVMLVVQIILKGYEYMVTDTPFKKTAAKSRIMEAAAGLLLALSAYVILNTINPRLVSPDVNISKLDIGVDPFKELGINYASGETDFSNIGPEGASCSSDIKPAKINFSGKGYASIVSDYLPAQNRAIPDVSKGVKTLLTAQAMKEGFWPASKSGPASKSWRTNNPGNIGNRDDGSTISFESLELGIKRQLKLFMDIKENREPNYKIGRSVKLPPGTGDDGKKYPALNFIFDGSICQYLSIYATGARHNTSYMSLIMGYFEKNGLKITPRTKFSEIYTLQ